jgi:hypothetical protein
MMMQRKHLLILGAILVVSATAVLAGRNSTGQAAAQWEYAVYRAGMNEWAEPDEFIHCPSRQDFFQEMGLHRTYPTASYPLGRLEADLINLLAKRGWELVFIENRTAESPPQRVFWFKRPK